LEFGRAHESAWRAQLLRKAMKHESAPAKTVGAHFEAGTIV